MPIEPLTSTTKSHGWRGAARATSIVPWAPEAKRNRAEDASSTSTERSPSLVERRVTKVEDVAHTCATGPSIHVAMSTR